MRYSKELQPYTLILANALIHRPPDIRARCAGVLRGVRGQGRRRVAREIRSYIAWIGYPVSDAHLRNGEALSA